MCAPGVPHINVAECELQWLCRYCYPRRPGLSMQKSTIPSTHTVWARMPLPHPPSTGLKSETCFFGERPSHLTSQSTSGEIVWRKTVRLRKSGNSLNNVYKKTRHGALLINRLLCKKEPCDGAKVLRLSSPTASRTRGDD